MGLQLTLTENRVLNCRGVLLRCYAGTLAVTILASCALLQMLPTFHTPLPNLALHVTFD